MKKIKNFSRFFALIKSLPGDREEIKENLVNAFTGGRTTSLREMYMDEYRQMCDSLQGSQSAGIPQKDFTPEIKRRRSYVLHRMQELGINTHDWAEVDTFCLDSRIAGKVFRQLSIDELKRMIPKLEAIAAKPRKQHQAESPVVDYRAYERIMEYSKNQIPN
jgi:hypothetical protein